MFPSFEEQLLSYPRVQHNTYPGATQKGCQDCGGYGSWPYGASYLKAVSITPAKLSIANNVCLTSNAPVTWLPCPKTKTTYFESCCAGLSQWEAALTIPLIFNLVVSGFPCRPLPHMKHCTCFIHSEYHRSSKAIAAPLT